MRTAHNIKLREKVRPNEMGSKYRCVVKIVCLKNMCNLKLLVGMILQEQQRPPTRGGPKRRDPVWETNTLMGTGKKIHNIKLREMQQGWGLLL